MFLSASTGWCFTVFFLYLEILVYVRSCLFSRLAAVAEANAALEITQSLEIKQSVSRFSLETDRESGGFLWGGGCAAEGDTRMVCELLLSSVWLLFVVFWVETISVWLFLCLFYQDRAFYHWGDGVFVDDPGQILYMLSRVERSEHAQT